MDTRMLWRHGVPAALLIALCPSPGAAQTQSVDNPVKLDDGESVRISGLVSGTAISPPSGVRAWMAIARAR